MKGGILTIGREVLVGRITDTNAVHIARVLTRRGVRVVRQATVDDTLEEITEGLRWLLNRAHLVITTGGLGPTDDDLTVDTVAQALKRPLQEVPELRENILKRVDRSRRSDPAYRRAIQKMSRIPEGGAWIPNPVGVAPGVWIPLSQGGILLLPGVPEEMKALLDIFLDQYSSIFPSRVSVEKTFKSPLPYEALLAPYLEVIRREFPDVYIKSHVRPKTRPKITLQTWASTEQEATSRIQEVWEALLSRIRQG